MKLPKARRTAYLALTAVRRLLAVIPSFSGVALLCTLAVAIVLTHGFQPKPVPLTSGPLRPEAPVTADTQRPSELIVYLTGSEEETSVLEAAFEQTRMLAGRDLSDSSVLVLTAGGPDLEWTSRFLDNLSSAHALLGQPGPTVIDLRAHSN